MLWIYDSTDINCWFQPIPRHRMFETTRWRVRSKTEALKQHETTSLVSTQTWTIHTYPQRFARNVAIHLWQLHFWWLKPDLLTVFVALIPHDIPQNFLGVSPQTSWQVEGLACAANWALQPWAERAKRAKRAFHHQPSNLRNQTSRDVRNCSYSRV